MKCYNHPDVDATQTCVFCHRPICNVCAVQVQGASVCRQCLAEGKYKTQDIPSISENDRILALACYLLYIIVPLIILVGERSQQRPFQRFHAIQSLMLSAVILIFTLFILVPVSVVVGILTLGFGVFCLLPIAFVPLGYTIYCGIRAFQGNYFDIPVLTNLARDRKWL